MVDMRGLDSCTSGRERSRRHDQDGNSRDSGRPLFAEHGATAAASFVLRLAQRGAEADTEAASAT
eukprot:3877647-Karenia_brevis.AAC.1